MLDNHPRTTVPAAAAILARLALLTLIVVVPLALSNTAESSISPASQSPITIPAEPLLGLENEALLEETGDSTAVRLVVTMVVTEDEDEVSPLVASPPTRPASVAGLRFWSGGDSTSTYMSIQLVEMFADLGAGATGTYYQKSTGLARPDYFDWFGQLQQVVNDFRPDIVVFMVGANDPQGIKDAEGATQWPFTDEWRALYSGRVGEVMDLLKSHHRYVVYVGQPNMGPTAFAEKMSIINELIKAEADKRSSVGYVDAWTLFSDESGAYQQILPNDDGVPTSFRAADGIHFTWAGGERLALSVLDEIYRQLDERPVTTWWTPPDDISELLP